MASNLEILLDMLKLQAEGVIEHYRELVGEVGEERAIAGMAEGSWAIEARANLETVVHGSPALDTQIIQWAFPLVALVLDLEEGNEMIVKGEDGIWTLVDKQSE